MAFRSGTLVGPGGQHRRHQERSPEAIAQAVRRGLRVEEVPVAMRERQHGTSSIGPTRTLYYLVKVSLALLLLPAERRRPAEIPG